MADWLKVNHSLVRSAKIRGLMRELRCKKHAALGLAVNWLCWVDEQTKDGQTGLLPDELDDEIGFRGCTDALISIGWAALGEDGCVYALEFGKHCGESAKERAENARRVAKCKANKKRVTAEVTENHYQGNEKTLPEALPEKNRIIDIDTKGVVKATLYSERDARPCAAVVPPPTRGQDGFGAWVARVCAQIPQLCQMRTLPPDVEAAALVMYETGFEPTDEQLVALGAFWAAPGDCLHGLRRPGALRFLFEDLPDVCSRAQEWVRIARREARKAAAAGRARKRAAELSEPISRTQDEADRNMELWREVCEEDEHA